MMMAYGEIELRSFLSPSDDWTEVLPLETYKQITVRLWGKGVVLRGTIQGNKIAAEKQRVARVGQFIISKIDARHGASGLVPEYLDGAVVSSDFPLFNIDPKVINSFIFNWFVKTSKFIEICRQASKGSTNRVRLKEDRLLDLTAELPSISEQDDIVERLNAIDEGLSERNAVSEELERDANAMLQSAFHEIIQDAFYEKMSVVAPQIRRSVEIEDEAEYPELGVRSFGKGTFHKPSLSGLEVGTKRLFTIHKKDLVFSNVFAWEGAIAVATDKDHNRVGSHRFITCVPEKNMATPDFLRFYMLSAEGMEKIRAASPGEAGRNKTLGLKKLDAIEVPVPPIEKQHWFDRLQAKVQEIKAERATVQTDVDALIPSLLNQVFEKLT